MKQILFRLMAGATLAATMTVAAGADDARQPGNRFEVSAFHVDGNTLLPQPAVDAALAPYIGRDRDIGDLRRAADALEAAYRARGFGLVRVVLPEQEMRQGAVRLQVVETKLGKVTVEGNTAFDAGNIRRSLPALQEGTTPDLGRLSQSLRLANDNPVKQTTVRLQSGGREGEVDAVVKVADSRPWRFGVNIDNSGTGSAGRTHVGLNVVHANVGGRDHVLALQYITAPERPDALNAYGIGYRIPLYGLGDSIELFGLRSDVDAGTINAGVVNLQVSGKGTIYGARYNLNLARNARYDGRLVFGVDHRTFRNDVQLFGLPIGNEVAVRPVAVGYAAKWTLARTDLNLSMTAWRNIPGGSHGGDDDIRLARSNGSPDYALLRYGASVTHAFANDWQAHAALNGQYTRDSLIPREQFGAGGIDSVRGFTEREIADDKGHAGRIELYTPNLCAHVARAAGQCRAVAFHDMAHVARNDPLAGERRRETIAGAGLGLRFALDRLMSVQLDIGRVTNAGGLQGKGDHRMHFMMNVTY